ncbi:MAG: MBL fold metallo-hydrolase [Clostridia bacterium]|nr:MBL fold metallo-hydrolase [Clostridia bacterium]
MEKLIENDKIEIYIIRIPIENSGHLTNCYFIIDKDSKEGIIVDPAYNEKYIIEEIKKAGFKIKVIYLTHCHGDHIGALEGIYEYLKDEKAIILIHEKDKEGIFDKIKSCSFLLGFPNFKNLQKQEVNGITDGTIIDVESIRLKVYHTPGHTNGSSILYEESTNTLITGDTLFYDCYGRTDLESGNIGEMKESLKKIFNNFKESTKVYPGHGIGGGLEDIEKRIKNDIF